MHIRLVWMMAAIPFAVATQSFAQEVSSCDGTWKYTFIDSARGWPADAEAKILGNQGTFVVHLGQHKAKNSPCRDKELSLVVERCTAKALVFSVDGNAMLQGCPTFTAHFKRTAPDTAEGLVAHGQLVTAHREH